MQTDIRAFICGCKGFDLSADEQAFIRQTRPWGLILFKRNIRRKDQVSDLVKSFRSILGRAAAPVLIDQEGGRVQRLGPPLWPAYPSAASFHQQAAGNVEAAAQTIRASTKLLAADLHELGITIDCLPVLDVPSADGHGVIGDRAYAEDPQLVARYGAAAAAGLMAGGVLPVMKHIPGHGRARADSHLELPIVETGLAQLQQIDFAPFKALAHLPMAMSAHVVYTALDPHNPATTSPHVIGSIIRDWIGFDGLLLSDDLSMKALSGSFAARTSAAFAAGIDMALHCNGDLEEAGQVALAAPALQGKARERAENALNLLKLPMEPVDV